MLIHGADICVLEHLFISYRTMKTVSIAHMFTVVRHETKLSKCVSFHPLQHELVKPGNLSLMFFAGFRFDPLDLNWVLSPIKSTKLNASIA